MVYVIRAVAHGSGVDEGRGRRWGDEGVFVEQRVLFVDLYRHIILGCAEVEKCRGEVDLGDGEFNDIFVVAREE